MEHVTLGKTGITVSRLCFGSLAFSPLQTKMEPADAASLMRRAWEVGVNFVDTAQLYDNYAQIKAGLDQIDGGMVVASKTYAYTAERAEQAVEQARRALNRDVIDIFMLHEQESIHTLRGHMPALDALYTLKARGVIRAVGASMHHVAAVRGAVELGLDVIHPIINIAGLGIQDGDRYDMEEALRAAHDAGIGVYAMKVLGGGNLFGRAAECLNYALDNPDIDSIAVGMSDPAEIDANVSFLEHRRFSEAEQSALNAKKRRLHIDEWCSGCAECTTVCPAKALTIRDGRAVCNPDKCLLCGYCSGYCPLWAIKII